MVSALTRDGIEVVPSISIRFRVDTVYRDHFVCLYFDGNLVFRRKARILTPGEMEAVVLTKAMFSAHKSTSSITVAAEEATNA